MIESVNAENMLEAARLTYPGKWIEHSYVVAKCAEKIANQCKHLEPKKAYSLGLLHDIGRKDGETGFRHIILGYNYLKELGEMENAKICMTHSFPYKNCMAFTGENNCTEAETIVFSEYINSCKYDDYDRLIQLCDGVSLSTGAVILEKRLVDVTLRRGFNEFTLDKWRAYMNLKRYFDELAGIDIYQLIL